MRQTRPNAPPPQRWDDWDRPAVVADRQAQRGGFAYATIVLVLLSAIAVCAAAFLIVRMLLPRAPALLPTPGPATSRPIAVGTDAALPTAVASPQASPAPGQALVRISPEEGTVNTLITIDGQGWWPGEAVFISLRSPEEQAGHGFAYAAAVADNVGRIRTAFSFPNELRWQNQSWAEVIARGSRSNLEATTRFSLVTPTPTSTVPVPTLPPYTPYTPAPIQPTATRAPTRTPAPTATPTQVTITDWRGEYYANPSLSGRPALVRNDVEINFPWGTAGPAPNLPADGFSARWTRARQFRDAIYRFTATADDGVRVFVDDHAIIDEWHDSSATTYSADVRLAKGTHTLRVEYYERVGGAVMQFDWIRIDQPTATPTAPGPTSVPTGVAITDWRGEYYANPNLAGTPALLRNDYYVDFDWGLGSPAAGVPADGFSARWTRSRDFRDGQYEFTVTVDDGVRLYIDDQLIIDEWHDSSRATYSVTRTMTAGTHRLRIEYYDRVGEAVIQFSFTRK